MKGNKSMKKRCRRCEQLKQLTGFSAAPSNSDGYTHTCKPCVCARNKSYWQTPQGRISYIYNIQKTNSVVRGHQPPAFTMAQLYAWALNNGLMGLVSAWETSGYHMQLAPSVDRLNDALGYTLDNIQLVTWKENNDKAYADRKSCKRVTKQNRKIQQYTLAGQFIATFGSIAHASRVTGVTRTNISPAANPEHLREQAGNFKWKYTA